MMGKMKVLLVICTYVALVSAIPCSNSPPVWPNQYQVKGSLYMPYAELTEPFRAWYDSKKGNSRIDYYDGTAKTFQFANYPTSNGSYVKIVPETTQSFLNRITCFQVDGSGGVTPQTVLPDMSKFKCEGNGEIDGVKAQKWTMTEQNEEKINNQIVWVKWVRNGKKGNYRPIPVYYEIRGYDTLMGSHFDHYYFKYHNFVNKKPKEAIWNLPATMECRGFPGPGMDHVTTFNPIKEFVHNYQDHVSAEWDKFVQKHQKQYSNSSEHTMRRNVFTQNHRLVHSHNRAGHSYQLALNHFSDWTMDELRSLRGRKRSQGHNGGQPFPYEAHQLDQMASALPANFDWRLYGAVNPVKDQAICGSCWSFGTTGTIEGAYFVKTGQLLSLSEQALMDCSWGYGNNGCDGGEDFRSYEWMLAQGGIPLEAEYGPYRAMDSRCHANKVKLVAPITGWVNVTSLNEKALKVAIFKKGPISIGIDAALTTFSFYSNGVYDDPNCKGAPEDLDHAVLAVGYGVLNGEKYWLVKNSWSTWWGNDGYILIAVKGNICGVMTDPTYVTM